MRFNVLALVAPSLVLASALGCSVAPANSEGATNVESAATAAGVSAALTVKTSGTTYSATMVVTNGSAEPIKNWQVVVSMPKSTVNVSFANTPGLAAVTGAYVHDLGSNSLLVPTSATASIAAGKTQTISWGGTYGGTTPSVVSVDGVASGTAYAGNAADGIDPVALGAATTAYKMALDYEKGKLANNGDANYPIYDQTIWSAQTFRVASGNATIEFDPNAPGYAFVPNSLKVDLASAQLDKSLASYLTSGLINCFAATDGSMVYAFRADFLKGFSYPTKNASSVTNPDGSVDNFTVTGAPLSKGQDVVTVTASSGPTKADPDFGIMRYLSAANVFPTYWTAVYPKFTAYDVNVGSNPGSWHGRYTAACSPFNGPGGTSNPYFVLSQTINGVSQNMAAWFQGVGSQSCNNGCTATFSVDPIPYALPAAYYDSTGTLVGPQANPFALSIVSLYADPAHAGQWATRTVLGVQHWGTFSVPVSVLGTTIYLYQQTQ
jgi:hypothetical protein